MVEEGLLDDPALFWERDDECDSTLLHTSNHKLQMAREYLSLTTQYPVALRSIIIHIRRMCKHQLNVHQLMKTCINCTSTNDLHALLDTLHQYYLQPWTFIYDQVLAKTEQETLARKQYEEGKRMKYEARMRRKAKREGKLDDLEFYLKLGANLPTVQEVETLKTMTCISQRLDMWKTNHHSQHCIAHHLEKKGCPRGDRACAFLHVDAKEEHVLIEDEEVAG